MVFFNYATMEMTAKIVYYGPGLGGKTTNLQCIYNKTNPKTRGEMVSLATETDRTLFFDLLPIRLGKIGGFKTRFQLYTVPGQVFYNSTRKLVLKGVDAVVFIADSQEEMLDANIESLENLEENLAEHNLKLDGQPFVIQYNKRDLPNILPIEVLNKHLNHLKVPHYGGCAVSGMGVLETLKGISRLTLAYLKRKTGEQYADDDDDDDESEEQISVGGSSEDEFDKIEIPNMDPERESETIIKSKDEIDVELDDDLDDDLEEISLDDDEFEGLSDEADSIELEEFPGEEKDEFLDDSDLDMGKFIPEEEDEPKAAPPSKSKVSPVVETASPQPAATGVPAYSLPENIETVYVSESIDAPSDEVVEKEVVRRIVVPVRLTKEESLKHVSVKLKLEIDCRILEDKGTSKPVSKRDKYKKEADMMTQKSLEKLFRSKKKL